MEHSDFSSDISSDELIGEESDIEHDDEHHEQKRLQRGNGEDHQRADDAADVGACDGNDGGEADERGPYKASKVACQ